ncbi:MAG TPA: hypothetical protein VKM72_26705 [Thermoanaerobaculia bacterium]|nr:hypothetical protein [Thermoanaerobaculia bacterium]
MSRNSQDEMYQDWSLILKVVRETEAELPGVAPYLAALDQSHGRTLSCRIRRDGLVAASQEATRQLNEALGAGQEAASALRSYIKSVLGYRNEKLVRYGIKPVRKRRRAVPPKPPCSCRFVS